jgi:hypothetical protein
MRTLNVELSDAVVRPNNLGNSRFRFAVRAHRRVEVHVLALTFDGFETRRRPNVLGVSCSGLHVQGTERRDGCRGRFEETSRDLQPA